MTNTMTTYIRLHTFTSGLTGHGMRDASASVTTAGRELRRKETK